MINFRYHLIAVTGVALAVAVGLTLGAAALDGPATGNVQDEARSLRKSNAQLRDRLAALQDELGHSEGYVKDAAPLLLDNRLAGKQVLVLALPGADKAHVAAVTRDLKLADATLTGTVRVTERFSDPQSREDARDLATRLLPPNVTDVPADADGVTASAMVLASVLLVHDPPVEPTDVTAAITGYEAAELIEVAGELRGPAQGVVIVGGRDGCGGHPRRHGTRQPGGCGARRPPAAAGAVDCRQRAQLAGTVIQRARSGGTDQRAENRSLRGERHCGRPAAEAVG